MRNFSLFQINIHTVNNNGIFKPNTSRFMTLNEQRDIILNALYFHYNKGTVKYEDFYKHLRENTPIDQSNLHQVIENLVNDKYMRHILSMPMNEYIILPAGIEIIENFGGFVGQQKARQSNQTNIVNNLNTGGGHVINSPIGNQDLRLRDVNNSIAVDEALPTATKINVHPIDKPDGWLKKLSKFCASVIGRIIIGVIIAAIGAVITWHVKDYFDERKQKLKAKTPTEINQSPTVKKL